MKLTDLTKKRLMENAGLEYTEGVDNVAEARKTPQEIISLIDQVIKAGSDILDKAKMVPGYSTSERLEHAISEIAVQIVIEVADEAGLLKRDVVAIDRLVKSIKNATSIDQAKQLMVKALEAMKQMITQ